MTLPQTQESPELVNAQELGELELEPLNKALEEKDARLNNDENEALKESESPKNKENPVKQELVDECKARSKSAEDENQQLKKTKLYR
jgi:hypothetical protein